MPHPLRAIVAAALLLLIGMQPAVAAADATWLVLSDIHLDPTGKMADGTANHDSDPALLAAAIAAMQRAAPNPAVVVIAGTFSHTTSMARARSRRCTPSPARSIAHSRARNSCWFSATKTRTAAIIGARSATPFYA